MMKNMILPIAFTALIASMTACSDETDPILTQKDWDGTATVSYTHLTLPMTPYV